MAVVTDSLARTESSIRFAVSSNGKTPSGIETVAVAAPGTTPGGTLNAANQDSILNLAAAWQAVEFILVGDCCNSQANFNAGSTVVVRTTVHNGTTNAPTCLLTGYTGETNNLTLVGATALATGPSPAIQTNQSNIAGTAASCSSAAGVGDPHLQTFSGLLYDFQATGDFILAEATDFAVQARHVSGAPTWPNVAVNAAVATRMGDSRVAICAGEAPLVVDGTPASLDDGKVLSLPSGVDILRFGNVYLVVDQSGNSMRAVVNSTWIDVSVGLGMWPTDVHGLLANRDGNLEQVEGRDGTVLNVPLSFEALYGKYAESWRVRPDESLLTVCGEEKEHGVPSAPFFAKDLDPAVAERTRRACLQAGVKEGPLLDACTLDVAVLGKEAATVYVGAAPPNAVGQ